MRLRWQGICLGAVLLGSFVSLVHAANPEDEYRKLIRVDENIQPLGEHPFGENISLYDGSLSFTQTDISLPGNGPTLQLIRHFEVYGNSPITLPAEQVFGNWELEVPHLETLTAGSQPTAANPTGVRMWDVNAAGHVQGINGWQTDNTGGTSGNPNADVNARCSNFTAPPSVVWHLGDSALEPWDPQDWWKGYHLIMPGEGGQDILGNVDASTKVAYPAVTKTHWRFSCLPATANGQPGEGFLGHAPDGTLYWFDYLVYRDADGISRQLESSDASLMPRQSPFKRYANATIEGMLSLLSGASVAHAVPTTDNITRSLGVLLVTKIQDRFGNTLNYSYDSNGDLTGITASDGRALSVIYAAGASRIQSVTLQAASGEARTWVYTYSESSGSVYSLVDVQLPDGSHWHYDLGALQSTILRAGSAYHSCTTLRVPSDLSPITGTITHPSGLVGRFTVQGMKHGRSYVPQDCIGMRGGDPTTGGSYALLPEAWYSLTTTKVVVSGAGVPTETWNYSYSPSNESWYSQTASYPTTVWTDVTTPDGSTTRHIFSNRYDITESKLLRTEFYVGAAGSSTLLRSEDSGYASPTTPSLPTTAGVSLLDSVNMAQVTQYSPLNLRTITQDGQTYTWQALAFDAYAQPTDVKRSNNIAGQTPFEELTSYLNDPNTWVLGLPQTMTNKATGEVESSNTYNSLDELTARARFGQTLMHYTWNSAGQLASFTDGDNHTTTLGSYVRGIPTAIGYPDGTDESLAVDDLGQITAITDQAGHTTHYGYDTLGRLAQITYPYDSSTDSASWYPKTFSYSYVTGAERGLAAGHWRRITTQGAATDTTYFDAELRPVLDDTSNGSTDISTATGYDWRGLTTFVSYPVSGSPSLSAVATGAHSTYDALGRLTQTQQDSELGLLTTSTAYLSGARKQVTDPKGNVTTTTYQVFDRPTYDAVLKVQVPTGIIQTTARDVYGNPLSITQSGSYGTESDSVTKSLYYDSYHRLCRTTEPETGSTVIAYDGANNLAWSADGLSITGTDCGQGQVAAAAKTARTYDAMNRVLTIQTPSGTQSTKYTYTPLGHTKTAVSGLATQDYAYNSLGLLGSESLEELYSGATWTLSYGYDAYGHLASVSYPASTGTSESVTYAPDAWGRPTRVGDYATRVSYYPDGKAENFTFANGTSYLAEENTRHLTSNFTYGAGSNLVVSEDLAYDKDGNLGTITDLVDGTHSKTFGYDALNRLSSADAPHLYGVETYTYDPINNLRTRLTGGVTYNYNYDASNKLTSITQGASKVADFGYDVRGNEVIRGSTTLAFDAKNQLIGIPGVESYAYDAEGRRVEKFPANGSRTYYFYNRAGQLMYRYVPGTATGTNFIYLGTKLVARHDFILGAVVKAPALAPVLGDLPAASGTGVYRVGWGGVAAATYYNLEESAGGGEWAVVLSSDSLGWSATKNINQSYAYRVQACNSTGCGPWSESKKVVVEKVPAVPSGLHAYGMNLMEATLSLGWDATTNATSYTLMINGSTTVTMALPTYHGAWSRGQGEMHFSVKACGAYGCSAWSPSISVDDDNFIGGPSRPGGPTPVVGPINLP